MKRLFVAFLFLPFAFVSLGSCTLYESEGRKFVRESCTGCNLGGTLSEDAIKNCHVQNPQFLEGYSAVQNLNANTWVARHPDLHYVLVKVDSRYQCQLDYHNLEQLHSLIDEDLDRLRLWLEYMNSTP